MASSSFFTQEKKGSIIIFAPMKEGVARSLLQNTIEHRLGEGEAGEPFAWLISDNGPGKLKIYYSTFGQVGAEIKYEYGTLDLVHTKNGWRLIKPLESPDVEVMLENIDKHNASLMQEINKIPAIHLEPRVRSIISPLVKFENFQQGYLITPKGERASSTYLYCWEETAPTPTAFLCAGTGKLMDDPVTVVNPKTRAEERGKSYERAYLIGRGYQEYSSNNKSASFVTNRALKDVITAVEQGDLSAVGVALNDSITQDVMEKPVLSPGGNSFGEKFNQAMVENF